MISIICHAIALLDLGPHVQSVLTIILFRYLKHVRKCTVQVHVLVIISKFRITQRGVSRTHMERTKLTHTHAVSAVSTTGAESSTLLQSTLSHKPQSHSQS